jgi:glycine cleavage system H protein
MAGDFPDDLRYTESDEWVRRDGDEMVSGITSYATDQLGDIVYVQLPAVGTHVGGGDSFGEIESVKAVAELYAPIAGEILAVNEELEADPARVNDDPYGRGWMVRFRADSADDFESLLDAQAYEQHTKEAH